MITTALSALLAFTPVGDASGKVVPVSLNQVSIPQGIKELVGRITYYHRFQDRYGNKVKMDDDLRAKEGVTVAAHPSFPFGTKVYIPSLVGVVRGDGVFIVQDRGKDVTRKKASRGKAFVFDVYIEAKTPQEAKRRLNHLTTQEDDYMSVYVIRDEHKENAKLQQMGGDRESYERSSTSRNQEKQCGGGFAGRNQPSV